MKKLLVVLTLMAAFVPAAALAQDTPRRDPVDNVTSYEFTDGSDVRGGRYSPDDALIRIRDRRRRDTLVRPRPHYINEMLKSVENI